VPLGHLGQPLHHALAELGRQGEELLVGDGADALDGCRAGDGVAAVRRSQTAGVDRVDDLGPADDASQRHPGRKRLADRHQVGHHAGVLDRPQLAGAAHARLHLVRDVDDAVLLAQGLQALDELGRHHREAALALHRLEDHAGHRLRIDVRLEHELDALERILGADAAVGIGRRRAVDLGRERPHALLVDQLRGQRHGQQRAAVEAAIERDHGVAAGVVAGDLDRVLDRLGARVDQHRLLGVRARRVLAEQLGHLEVGLVGRHREAGVKQRIGLLLDRCHHRIRGVPDVEHADAAGEVDVLLAVHVHQPGAVRVVGNDRRQGDAAGDVGVTHRKKRFRSRSNLHCHRCPRFCSILCACEYKTSGPLRAESPDTIGHSVQQPREGPSV
jgi:hypothetical protein